MATNIGFNVTALDRASRTFAAVADAVDGLRTDLRQLDRTTANPTVDVDTSKASKKVGAFATELQRRIRAAVDSLPDIDLDADATAAQREILGVRRALESLADQRVGVDIDAGTAHRAVQELQARLARLSAEDTNIDVRADTAAAAAQLAGFEQYVARLDGRNINIRADVDTGGAVAKMAALGAASNTAGGQMGSMGGRAAMLGTAIAGVAAPAVGILSAAIAALPSVVAVGGAALGTIALGMDGIKAAAETARPAFDGLKAAVSSSFESSLAPAMQGISAMLPQLHTGFQSVATAIGGTATQLVNWANTPAVIGQLNGLLTGTTSVIKALQPGILAVAQNFMTLADSGLENFMMPLAGHLSAAAQGFGEMIAAAQQSGALQGALEGLADTFGVLLGFLNNLIGAGLESWAVLAGPMNTAFSLLGQVIVALMPALTSLTQMFLSVLNPVLSALLPILAALTPAFTQLAGMIGTLLGGAITALMPLLTSVAQMLGGVLTQALNAISPLIPVIVGAFSTLVAALMPIVPIVGQVASTLISALAPVIGVIAGAIGQLVPLAASLVTTLVSALAPILPIIAQAFTSVLQAVLPIVPILVQMVSGIFPVLGSLISALAPVVAQLAQAFLGVIQALLPLIPAALQIVQAIFPVLLGLITSLAPLIGQLAGAFAQVVTALTPLIPPIVQLVQAILPPLLSVVTAILPVLTGLATIIVNVVVVAVNILATVLTAIIGVVAAVLTAIVGFVTGLITNFSTFAATVSAIWTTVWNFIRDTAMTVWNTISTFFTTAFAVFQAVFTTVWTAIQTIFTTVWNFILTTAQTIWNAISVFFTTAFALFQAAFQLVWNTISTIFSTVWNLIYTTAMTIWNTIAAFFTAAFAAYQAAFQLIWDTISTIFTTVWNAILTTAQTIWDAISAFFAGAFETFTTFFSDTWDNIVGIFDRIWSGVSDIATRVWDSVRGIFIDGINWVIRKINAFADVINTVAQALGFDINLHLNEIPRQQGGPITARRTGGPIGLATGGSVGVAGGGKLPGRNKPGRDRLPAIAGRQHYRLDGGEYITNRYATAAVGPAGMAAVNNAHRQPVDIVPRRRSRATMARYADGGVIKLATGGELAATAQRLVPGTVMSSGFRPGDSGYHGRNQAADLVGNFHAINQAIARDYGATTNELIYTPGINLLNGRPHTYNAATQADHHDHVHWAMSGPIAGGLGLLAQGAELLGATLESWARGLLQPFYDWAIPARDDPKGGLGKRAMAGGGIKIMDHLIELAKSVFVGGGGSGVAVAPGPVVDVVRRTAEQFGWAGGPEWDAIGWIISKESGWDPNAQNPNSTAYGLFQFLDGTWAETGIAKTADPSQQALAGMRYIQRRYNTPTGAQRFWQANGWYDRGGLAQGPGVMLKETLRPERVLSPRQTDSFEQLVGALTSGRPQALVSAGVRAAQDERRGHGTSGVSTAAFNAVVDELKALRADYAAVADRTVTAVREARPVNVYARNDDVAETGRSVALQMRL